METKHLNERGKMFFDSDHLADCSFHFPKSGSHLKANKTLLALASPIMDTMFFGNSNYTEAKTDVVEIVDIDVDVFKKFISWIYAKELALESVEDAVAVYQVANKYEVIDLEVICAQYVATNVSPENVCLSWKFADLYNDNAVKLKALKIIRNHTTEMLNSSSFQHLNENLLMLILAQDELWIKNEMVLLETLEKFARINSLGRDQLDAAVKCIRFKIINAEEFIKYHSVLLTDEEKLAIVESQKSGDDTTNYPKGFSECTIPRSMDYLEISECDQRFLKCVKDSHYSGEEIDCYTNYDDRDVEGTIADLMFRDLDWHSNMKILSVLRNHLPREKFENNNKYLTRILEDDNPRVIVELIACLKYFSFPDYLEVPDYDYGLSRVD